MDKTKNDEQEGLKSHNMSWSALNNLNNNFKITFQEKRSNSMIMCELKTRENTPKLHKNSNKGSNITVESSDEVAKWISN